MGSWGRNRINIDKSALSGNYIAFEKVIEIYDVIVGEEGIIPFHCLS
jgi:hypothetical protein